MVTGVQTVLFRSLEALTHLRRLRLKEDGNGTLKIYLNSDIADDFGEKSTVQMTSEQIDTVCKGA